MSSSEPKMPDGPIQNPGLWRGDNLQKSGDYVIDMSRQMVER